MISFAKVNCVKSSSHDNDLQCDQMAILYFQHLSIRNNENGLNSIEVFPKKAQHFANYELNSQTIVKDLKNVVTLAKFHQIWSH